MPNLSKIDGERNLYRNPESGTYFVRLQYKDDRGKAHDTFKSLKTKLKPDALKKMSAWNAAQAAADLGIAIKPRDAAKRATVRAVIERYVQNGYPDKTGIPRSPGLHLRYQRHKFCRAFSTRSYPTAREPISINLGLLSRRSIGRNT